MKIMIIHPGTQHSTKLAAALKKNGHDVKLVTTVYNKKNSFINKISRLLPIAERKRLISRMNLELNDSDILLMSELSGLFLLLLNRIDKSKKIYVKYKYRVAKKVGIKAAKLALKDNYDLVIAFDSYAYYPFNYLNKEKSSIIKVIDYSAAYAPAAKETYMKVILKYPILIDTMKKDRCVLWDDKYYDSLCKEAFLTDFITCASEYTKGTLVKYGVESSKIYVVPYGYNPSNSGKTNKLISNDTFNILFVGGVNVMKGIAYLIDALKQIEEENISLTLVGNVQDVIKDMALKDKRIIIKGYISHNDIHVEYENANLFIFPSLSDGFGFAPLEAMSYGVPCLVTNTSGISDIIEDGIDGFIVESESVKVLAEKIRWGYNNKESLHKMGVLAKDKVSKYSVENYAKRTQNFIERIYNE